MELQPCCGLWSSRSRRRGGTWLLHQHRVASQAGGGACLEPAGLECRPLSDTLQGQADLDALLPQPGTWGLAGARRRHSVHPQGHRHLPPPSLQPCLHLPGQSRPSSPAGRRPGGGLAGGRRGATALKTRSGVPREAGGRDPGQPPQGSARPRRGVLAATCATGRSRGAGGRHGSLRRRGADSAQPHRGALPRQTPVQGDTRTISTPPGGRRGEGRLAQAPQRRLLRASKSRCGNGPSKSRRDFVAQAQPFGGRERGGGSADSRKASDALCAPLPETRGRPGAGGACRREPPPQGSSLEWEILHPNFNDGPVVLKSSRGHRGRRGAPATNFPEDSQQPFSHAQAGVGGARSHFPPPR